MKLLARLLSIAVLGAARLAWGAGPAPQKSLLPKPDLPGIPMNAPCRDDVVSKNCEIDTIVWLRGMPLKAMWHQRDYRQLDRILLALCAEDTRLPDGQPELLVFPRTFRTLIGTSKDWSGLGASLREWRAQSPDSPAQAMIETMYWQAYAWHGRGNGYASSVPPEAWDLFRERLAKASARLEEIKAVAGNCPWWHSMNIEILIDSSAPRSRLNAAYDEAVKAFPASQQIHVAMSRAKEPKWGGAPGEYERFARRAAGLSQRDEGSAMYARLFWVRDCSCEDAFTFGQPGDPDWKLMKAGFEEMLQRYPDQVHNRNKFASYACRANDRATYSKLRRELGDSILDPLWPDSWKVDVCDRRMEKK
ncbi:DUF4034 domain-containing protein [Duganella sp. Root1480D1]|uniref:DUF4034 domain-containing protein n=1 Tax=Duganella sp. Root1480D1 TaxID=1736471 RepID=UPI000710B3E4|nr:DUF4034 domain-containing protein [Duganella sp. Root1480D1]KQZ45117.1 hypothetical protein ASD58_02410 [Duganella sp. Root1480D1]